MAAARARAATLPPCAPPPSPRCSGKTHVPGAEGEVPVAAGEALAPACAKTPAAPSSAHTSAARSARGTGGICGVERFVARVCEMTGARSNDLGREKEDRVSERWLRWTCTEARA